ncbi:MAG: diguanylate cyclase [Ruminiclostridium sp.]|nr:diguanylate cyclase [Ruminiclostridium sp.]
MRIKTLLITVLTCFIIIPSVAFAIVANVQMNSIALQNYTDAAKDMAERQASSLSEYFATLSSTTKQIAENPYITGFTKEGKTGVIDEFIGNYTVMIEIGNEDKDAMFDLARIIVTDSYGNLHYSTGQESVVNDLKNNSKTKTALKNISSLNKDGAVYCYSKDIYAEYGEDDKEKTDPLFPDATGGSADIKLVVKQKSGNYDVLVFFNYTRMKGFATGSQFAANTRLVTIDSLGSIIDGTYLGNLKDNNLSAYNKLASAAGTGAAGRVDNFKGTAAGDIPTIGFAVKIAPIEGVEDSWSVAVVAETDKAYTASGNAAGGIIGTIVAVSIIMIVVAVILVFIVTKPLKIIEETLVKVRRGDHETRINIMANNEYGEIARSFNDLIDDIIVSEGRYRTIVEMSDNIIFEWNFKTNDVIFSNNFNKKFSYRAPSDHFGDSFLLKAKTHPDDSDRYHKDLERLSKGEEFEGNEYRWKNIYGDYIWILMRTSTIRDREGNVAKIVGVIVDIDRAKKSEKLLTERASYDSLTGLYNRESIERTIDNEIDLISVRKSEFAILFIDVDDFKIFNDKYSYATGDSVLKFVATTITEITEGFGTAGRYGGDEFIVCIRNVDVNDPTKIAQTILNTLKEGFTSDNGDKLSVNTSIGISIIQDSSMRVDEIIGMADDAMYKIKKSGKSNFGILNKEVVKKAVPDTVEEEDIIGGAAPEATEAPATDVIE